MTQVLLLGFMTVSIGLPCSPACPGSPLTEPLYTGLQRPLSGRAKTFWSRYPFRENSAACQLFLCCIFVLLHLRLQVPWGPCFPACPAGLGFQKAPFANSSALSRAERIYKVVWQNWGSTQPVTCPRGHTVLSGPACRDSRRKNQFLKLKIAPSTPWEGWAGQPGAPLGPGERLQSEPARLTLCRAHWCSGPG